MMTTTRELRDFQRRFWRTLPLTVMAFVLAMIGHRLQWMAMGVQSWVELIISIPIVLWAGWPFFTRGWQSVINRSPNMWTLIGLGTGAAFAYSVVATIAPQVFPDSSGRHGARRRLFRGGGGNYLADAAGSGAGAGRRGRRLQLRSNPRLASPPRPPAVSRRMAAKKTYP